MAYIRVDSINELVDGQLITFKAPCDCTGIEGIRVYYPKGGEKLSQLFTMKDAHGNNLAGLGNLFAAGNYVTAILNTINSVAYLQNSATNGYLEDRLSNVQPDVVDNLTSTSTTMPLSAKQGNVLNGKIEELNSSFSTAADAIGDALVAKGVSVPSGTSLTNMATLIKNNLVLSTAKVSLSGSFSDTSLNNTSRTKLITFSKAFGQIPKVTVACTNSSAFTCVAENVSQTSFVFRYSTTSGIHNDKNFAWSAEANSFA